MCLAIASPARVTIHAAEASAKIGKPAAVLPTAPVEQLTMMSRADVRVSIWVKVIWVVGSLESLQ